MVRFARPIHDERRNLKRRANSENPWIMRGIARFVTALGVRINPDRIVQRHQGIQRNKRIQMFLFRNNSPATVAFHAKALLKVNFPVVRMLIDRTGVPPACIL